MNKTLVVAVEQIRRTVLKRSFIFVLLSLPAFLALMIGPAVLLENANRSDLPVGYLDQPGLLAEARTPPAGESEEQFELRAFANEAAARQALEAGEIQAYYRLPADFADQHQLTVVYWKRPASEVSSQFVRYLRFNLLGALPDAQAWRAVEGSQLAIRNPKGTRVFPTGAPPLRAVLPVALGLAFGALLVTGGSAVMGGVVEEKGNRTMEVMLTSISPGRLVTGKLIGIVLSNLLQLVVWVVLGTLAIKLAGDSFGWTWFENPQPDWTSLLSVAVVAVPSYLFASALMFMLGSTVIDGPEGQSLGSILLMVLMVPVYALVAIASNPQGGLAVTLSLLPMTSILTIAIRNMLVVVPAWQIGLSAAIQIGLAVVAVWLAGRAFRLGMLRYGQRLRLGELLRRQPAET